MSDTRMSRPEMAAAVKLVLERINLTPLQGVMAHLGRAIWHSSQSLRHGEHGLALFDALPPGLREEFAPIREQLKGLRSGCIDRHIYLDDVTAFEPPDDGWMHPYWQDQDGQDFLTRFHAPDPNGAVGVPS